jgi:hypothetical protein
MNDFKWQLYDLTKDWTQAEDVAAKEPDKLRDIAVHNGSHEI